jgi:uncharacterized protein
LDEIARERGTPHIVDGYNRDDEGDWRPGRKAAREHDDNVVFRNAQPSDADEIARFLIQTKEESAGAPIDQHDRDFAFWRDR